ncbi:hypothetical protein ACO0LL_27255 [Undibacterium sp. TC4M20W]|uniref:hypothetical protein n=1 Tax=Undibacterium sp. TC4M20W TaxID=3413052 RepID=UPI003BF3A7CF
MRVAPIQVVSFLQKRGWQTGSIASLSKTLVFTHPLFKGRQLFLPEHEDALDYEDALNLLVDKLASIERTNFFAIQNELELTSSDTEIKSSDRISLRILKTVDHSETIPLSLANAVINGSEIMLLSGSCTAENPQHYFRRIDNKISNEIYNRTVFNHTQRGSFVMSISCSLAGVGEQLGLALAEEPNEWTKSRKAFVAIYRGVQEISHAISTNQVQSFAYELLNSATPTVSSNFCEALANIVEKDTGSGMKFDFNWSPYAALPSDIQTGKSIFIDSNMSNDLYTISEILKPKPAELTDIFIGTVEALSGDVTNTGEREGAVEFSILLKDGQKIRASADLTTEQYKVADQAHIGGAQYVSIEGKLISRPRVWQFEFIKSFKLGLP